MHACVCVFKCAYACVWSVYFQVLSTLSKRQDLFSLARSSVCWLGWLTAQQAQGSACFCLPGVRVQTCSIKAQVCKCGFWALNSGPGACQASTILAISPASRSNFLMRVSQPQFGEWANVHTLSHSRVVTHIRHGIQWCMESSYLRESTHAGRLCYQLEDWAIAGGSLHHRPRRLPNVLMLAWKPLDGDGGQKEGRGKRFWTFSTQSTSC